MSAQTIGFIGVGYMGHGMAKNIVEKGYGLVVMGHRNRAPVEDLISRGASEATSAREMAGQCDIVHLCVTGSTQVEALIRGPEGILASGKSGLIVIDCSTSDPVSTETLAGELAEAGMAFVDAPLGRTPKEAEEGTLDAMVGCDDETFAKIKPVLECWAANINHLGPTGTGHKIKLLSNFVALGYGALYSEAMAIGMRAGVAPEKFHAAIGSSRMRNGFYDTFMKYVIDRDRDAHKFTLANADKDMRYLGNMANAAGAANFLQSVVKDYFSSAVAQGKGDEYVPMLSDHVASLNGVSHEKK